MKKINYYWINDRELLVNGEKMLPEVAYQKYPEHAEELKNFVNGKKMDFNNLFIRDLAAETEQKRPQKTITEMIAEINRKIDYIFKDLNIKPKSNSVKQQKDDVYKLFCYVVEHSRYDESLMKEKAHDLETERNNSNEINAMRNAEIKDIYRCLIEGRSVCTSDAATLSLLYRQYGLKSQHLTIADKGPEGTGVHQVTAVKIDGQDYISDATLVRSTYQAGIISKILPTMALFEPDMFLNQIYGGKKEIKCAFAPITLRTTPAPINSKPTRLQSLIEFSKNAVKKFHVNETEFTKTH